MSKGQAQKAHEQAERGDLRRARRTATRTARSTCTTSTRATWCRTPFGLGPFKWNNPLPTDGGKGSVTHRFNEFHANPIASHGLTSPCT